jgi:hypothetical protein
MYPVGPDLVGCAQPSDGSRGWLGEPRPDFSEREDISEWTKHLTICLARPSAGFDVGTSVPFFWTRA